MAKLLSGERVAKSPYARHHKREFLYSETVRNCIKFCREGHTEAYDRLSGHARDRMLLSQVRRGIDVWRWPGLGWTRNDARFLSEREAGCRERGSQTPSLSPTTV